MLPFNFNQLYYFWTIAKSGSISAATGQLLLNQSTLSQQLKQLETSVGRRLLARSRRGVALTDEGRLVFEYCERIFGQAEELAGRLKSGEAAVTPLLRLGFCRSLSRDKVLGVAEAVKARHPHMLVKIASGTPEELEDRLRRRVCDLVLSNADLTRGLGRDYRARLVASIPHFFVAAPSYRRKSKGFPRMMDQMPLMVRPPDNPVHKDAMDFLRRNGVLPEIHAQVEDPDLILTMVLRGEGVGVLDPFTIEKHLRAGRLVKLHERPVGIRENLWLVCSRHPHSSAPVQEVIAGLMEGFRFDWKTLRRGVSV